MVYEVGKRIKFFREKIGISQVEFAERLGISKNVASNWEAGRNRPDVDYLMGICEILNVTADELLELNFTEKTVKLAGEELELLETYRNLSGENKIRLIGYLEALKEMK